MIEAAEIAEGFKMTEIGLLPEDWEALKLGDAVSKTKQKDPAKTPAWHFKYIDVSGISRESLTNEQHQIADILSAIDIKIEAEENKKQALDALFKTLLSLLMTGKIRVRDLDI